MDFDNISPELVERARACKTPEELIALAEEQGVELTDEQLEAVDGGVNWKCPDYCARQCVTQQW